MNPFKYQVTCNVCGETGMAHVRHTGKDWLGEFFSHEDPQVCADNLKRKAERTKDEVSKVLEQWP